VILSGMKLQAFLITTLLFLTVQLTTGLWSEAYQHMYDTAISGEFSNQMAGTDFNPFPEYMSGGAMLFHALTKAYSIRWVFFVLYTCLFISIWIINYQILKFSKDYPTVSRILLLLFFNVLFFESVSLYHMVRIAMFLGIAGMSVLINNKGNKIFSWEILPFFLVFLVGVWIRGNVIFFMLVFLTGAFIIHKKSLKPLLFYWVTIVIAIVPYLIIVFGTDYSNDLNNYFLRVSEFKLHHNGAYTPDLKLDTYLDTIKYQAIQNYILGDEEHLNTAYYDKIGIFTNLSKVSKNHIGYAIYQFRKLFGDNIYLIVADIFLVIFYVILGGANFKNYRLKTILVFVFFYAVIFVICFVKMENRFIVPFQTFFLMFIIALHKPKLFTEQKYALVLSAFVVLVSSLALFFSMQKIDVEKNETHQFKRSLDYLAKEYAQDILVFNTGFITKNKPYETFYQKDAFADFFIYNYYAIQLHPMYRPYIEAKCNCNAGRLGEFYDYLFLERKENVLLLDGDERMNV